MRSYNSLTGGRDRLAALWHCFRPFVAIAACYSSARLWDDGIIEPEDTRKVLALALAAAESARDIVFSLGTPIAHAWRITSGTRRAPHGRLAARGSAPCAKVASVISPGITRKPAVAVARFQMTPRSAPFGISVQNSGEARAPARQAPTLEKRDAAYKASWPSKAGLAADLPRRQA